MLYRFLYPIARLYWLIFRPVTFGVRIILINDGKILLVRHTYLPDWMLPGGAVEYQEDFSTAIKRELREELNISLKNV
ncbi:MAG: NUDIX domain-containing protein [Patescibacteria group bacterium]